MHRTTTISPGRLAKRLTVLILSFVAYGCQPVLEPGLPAGKGAPVRGSGAGLASRPPSVPPAISALPVTQGASSAPSSHAASPAQNAASPRAATPLVMAVPPAAGPAAVQVATASTSTSDLANYARESDARGETQVRGDYRVHDDSHGRPEPLASRLHAANPYTGEPLTAAQQTTRLTGKVIATRPVPGLTVAAFELADNGTIGRRLGVSGGKTAQDGSFVIDLDYAPTTPIYLKAEDADGGAGFEAVDNTFQPVARLDLLTPFVTAAHSHFVVTPATHIAAANTRHLLARPGADVARTDFKARFDQGCASAMNLQAPRNLRTLPPRAQCIDFLALEPGGVADRINYFGYSDLLADIEWGAVSADVPSAELYTALALNSRSDFAAMRDGSLFDGEGGLLHTGSWIAGEYAVDRARPWSFYLTKTGMQVRQGVSFFTLMKYQNGVCAGTIPMHRFQGRYGEAAASELKRHCNRYVTSGRYLDALNAIYIDQVKQNRRTKYMTRGAGVSRAAAPTSHDGVR